MISRLFAALSILSSIFVGTIVYAQPASITIQLDRAAYSEGDRIFITGEAWAALSNEQIVIQVYNPAGTLTRIEPLSIDADGIYAYNYTIGGPLNKRSGEYKVLVTYRGITKQTAFSFTAAEEWQSYPAITGGRTYEIRYMISGGSVESMAVDVNFATLIVALRSTSNGELTMRVPNGIFPINIEPEAFVDTIPAINSKRTTSECYSEITVPFNAGTEEIEVVGSYIFGTEPELSPVNRAYPSNVKFNAEGEDFQLAAKLTASDCSFSFLQNERTIHTTVTGPGQGPGYFELTIPHRFLGGNYTVLLDGESLQEFSTSYNPAGGGEDSTTISFTYDPATVGSIDIIGTTAIPEFKIAAIILFLSLLIPVAARLRYHVS